jgi:hypothetical protein
MWWSGACCSISSVNLVVVIPLQSSDWRPPLTDGGKGEWTCAALALPTAKFRCMKRIDGTIVPEEAYRVRRRRITWKGGGRPQNMRVEIELARSLYSSKAAFAMLLFGFLAGLLLAPEVDLSPFQAAMEARVAQVWALLG